MSAHWKELLRPRVRTRDTETLKEVEGLVYSGVPGDVRVSVGRTWYDPEAAAWKATWVITWPDRLREVEVQTAQEARDLRAALRVLDGRNPDTGRPK